MSIPEIEYTDLTYIKLASRLIFDHYKKRWQWGNFLKLPVDLQDPQQLERYLVQSHGTNYAIRTCAAIRGSLRLKSSPNPTLPFQFTYDYQTIFAGAIIKRIPPQTRNMAIYSLKNPRFSLDIRDDAALNENPEGLELWIPDNFSKIAILNKNHCTGKFVFLDNDKNIDLPNNET